VEKCAPPPSLPDNECTSWPTAPPLPFYIDVVSATSAFPVLTVVDCLDGFLNETQALEITFVQVVEEISVVADVSPASDIEAVRFCTDLPTVLGLVST
jgi:hypothetical protein